ncbi:integrase core domain-containing protein [Brachyspira pilosicoli]|uniref:Transposase n=1 Tax=Brachyspira pilosicoli TaxID=52584 RepID=A0A5C8FC70_BRAPL|nr:integrase core domain-containing protein [Brachyspira pilosicoli]TXJ47014.1 transposase [Brachyspira pilosicoli]
MKRDYSTEFKLFIVDEALETKNIKRFLKIEEIPKSTFYAWLKKYKDTGTVANFSTRPKTSPNIFNNQEAINLIIKLYTKEYRGKHYIKAYLNREGINIGVTAIENVLKRNNLWRYKIKKKKKRYDKRKFVSKIEKEGKIVQIDTKYIKLGRKTVYQFTAVDLATRYSWRQIYEDKTPYSALSFLKYVLKTSPFKIQAIQTDNGIEYTYRCINTPKINIFDEYCLKNKLERRYIPIATPRYNGVVERVHGIDEREFYSRLNKNITVELLREKLKEYTHFYNNQRLISSLGYITIKERIKNIIASKSTISMAP